jgi:hypothetical protein
LTNGNTQLRETKMNSMNRELKSRTFMIILHNTQRKPGPTQRTATRNCCGERFLQTAPNAFFSKRKVPGWCSGNDII